MLHLLTYSSAVASVSFRGDGKFSVSGVSFLTKKHPLSQTGSILSCHGTGTTTMSEPEGSTVEDG